MTFLNTTSRGSVMFVIVSLVSYDLRGNAKELQFHAFFFDFKSIKIWREPQWKLSNGRMPTYSDPRAHIGFLALGWLIMITLFRDPAFKKLLL